MPAALEEHCHKEERTSRAEGGLDQICYHPPASWDDWLDTESWREQLLGDGVDYSSASTQREAQSEVNLAFLSLMPIYLFPLTCMPWHPLAIQSLCLNLLQLLVALPQC